MELLRIHRHVLVQAGLYVVSLATLRRLRRRWRVSLAKSAEARNSNETKYSNYVPLCSF